MIYFHSVGKLPNEQKKTAEILDRKGVNKYNYYV